MLRDAVLQALREWRSPPFHGEALSLQQIICEWSNVDDYPSRATMDACERDAAECIERIADGIVSRLRAED